MARIPSRKALLEGGRAKWHEVAKKCRTEAEREALSTRLIQLSRGKLAGAFSEDPRHWRVRKIRGHEVSMADLDPTDVCVHISDTEVRRIIGQCARAGLSQALKTTWTLHEDGMSQRQIAEGLCISVSAVNKRLARARAVLRTMVDHNVRLVFWLESHRGRKEHRTRGPVRKREPKQAA